jgi:hypothetical protein
MRFTMAKPQTAFCGSRHGSHVAKVQVVREPEKIGLAIGLQLKTEALRCITRRSSVIVGVYIVSTETLISVPCPG